ncbi:U4/U6 small nuclear ribonucleoprotein PRP31 [Malassezia restricta]|uniref:U4/U6 small nuclear ribonucleoprotein PRP31 n=1 Tax=Malassezia restricta TaxID=76775 RepID=UPI000DD16258|nr:U4/U6 small nuclear ribonucleoprotein PRP31 [Malassezia restricta]AXA49497.1 U4/U6 small nuclear ribonucleoprotein PRP31 [Malassezia restricta]
MSNSLADELLADVAEGESNAMDNDKEQYSSILYNEESSHAGPDESVRADTSMQYVDESHAHGASQPGNELESLQNNDASNTNIRSISKLYENDTLSELLKVIEQRKAQPPTVITGALEGSEEYFLIIRANSTALEIDHEMLALYKFIREHYAPRFPELETLVLNPWEFIQAVLILGNKKDLVTAGLEGILPQGTVVVISMTASTTTGQPLAAEEWQRIQDACGMVQSLEDARAKILDYVESRMSLLAPNLSALLGTRVATKLVGSAGGLASLARIPSCNMHLLGASKSGSSALSSIHGGSTRYSGYLAQCTLIVQTPEEYRTQALRMVSAKASLAARVDAGGSSGSRQGEYGTALYQEVERKIEKLLEPPPAKLVKALPVPNEGGRKQRRGGRRARKFREMHGLTELRKMQNRIEFGKEEEEASAFDETMGLGMINTKASGKIRASVANASSKARMSKANKDRLATLNRPKLSLQSLAPAESTSSGTASSLSFTPVQGIELVDPSRQKRVEEANAKWFREGQFSLVPGASKSSAQMPPSSQPNT